MVAAEECTDDPTEYDADADPFLLEHLAGQDLLPTQFQAVPGGKIVNLNVVVRRAIQRQDDKRLCQLAAVYDHYRAQEPTGAAYAAKTEDGTTLPLFDSLVTSG